MFITHNNKSIAVHTLFSEEQIKTRIGSLAKQINEDFGTQNPLVVLIVLNGSFIFAADLVRKLEMPTEIETTRLKSYEGTQSGEIKFVSPLNTDLSSKNVLIIEDIIDTGKSMDFLLRELSKHKVNSIRICTLLNKPESHSCKIHVDYVGFNIGKNFVVGYGLDLDGQCRNLPFIGELILP